MNQLSKDLIFLLSTYLGYQGTINLCQSGISCSGIWEYKLWEEFKEKSEDPERRYLELFTIDLSNQAKNSVTDDPRIMDLTKKIKTLKKERKKLEKEIANTRDIARKESYDLDRIYLRKYGHTVNITITPDKVSQLITILRQGDCTIVLEFLNQSVTPNTLLRIEIIDKNRVIYVFFVVNCHKKLEFTWGSGSSDYEFRDLPSGLRNLATKLVISGKTINKIFSL